MAKKNTEAKEKPTTVVVENPGAPEAPAAVAAETGASCENEVELLRAEAEKWQAAHGEASAKLAQIHEAALSYINVPLSSAGLVQDVKNVLDILHTQRNELQARVAELEGARTVELHVVGEASLDDSKGPNEDLAVVAYDLFRKNQTEGDFPAWDALDTPTQKLWRDCYAHVATGGAPRTEYEEAVKYLITVAE